MALTALRRTSHVFYRMSLNWDLSDVFLRIRLELRVFERKTTGKVLFLSHHVKGTYYQHDLPVDVNLDHLAEVVFIRFLHCKVLSPAPPHRLSMPYALERSHCAQPTFQE